MREITIADRYRLPRSMVLHLLGYRDRWAIRLPSGEHAIPVTWPTDTLERMHEGQIRRREGRPKKPPVSLGAMRQARLAENSDAVGDVLAALRAKPGSVSFGVSDSSAMLSGYLMNMLAKADMQAISYKGAGPLMIDLAGGHVPLAIGAVSSVQAAVRTGRVTMLGVTSKSAAFPDVQIGRAHV